MVSSACGPSLPCCVTHVRPTAAAVWWTGSCWCTQQRTYQRAARSLQTSWEGRLLGWVGCVELCWQRMRGRVVVGHVCVEQQHNRRESCIRVGNIGAAAVQRHSCGMQVSFSYAAAIPSRPTAAVTDTTTLCCPVAPCTLCFQCCCPTTTTPQHHHITPLQCCCCAPCCAPGSAPRDVWSALQVQAVHPGAAAA